jgi:DNA replication protein DnaC
LRAKGSEPRQPQAPECADCSDRGFFRFDVAMGHPNFGRMFPCPKCNAAGVAAMCGLYPHERSINVHDLGADKRPGAQAMIKAGDAFIGNPVGFLSVCGSYGNGKTILLMGIVNACLAKGIEARYLTAQELKDYLYQAFDKTILDTDRGRVARLAALPVLAIDEFHTAHNTPYAEDMQKHLIDERYRNKHALGTVFAWNGDADTIPWPMVRSRMSEFPLIHNTDDDMRAVIGEAKAER